MPVDAMRDVALSLGLQPLQVAVHGLPLRRGFWLGARRGSLVLADEKTGSGHGRGDGRMWTSGGVEGSKEGTGSPLIPAPPQRSVEVTEESRVASGIPCGDDDEQAREKWRLHMELGLRKDAGASGRAGVDEVGSQQSKASTTVLVVGGGDGMGNIVGVAKGVVQGLCACIESSSDDEAVDLMAIIVCGTNAAARQSISDSWRTWCPTPKARRALEDKMHVLGFCQNMDALMRASDVLVTKAGPGTIAEACIFGLPIIISGFLPGQEEDNVKYVEDGKMGCFCDEPAVLAETLAELLTKPEALRNLSAAARDAGRPYASLHIAHDILEILEEHRYAPGGWGTGGEGVLHNPVQEPPRPHWLPSGAGGSPHRASEGTWAHWLKHDLSPPHNPRGTGTGGEGETDGDTESMNLGAERQRIGSPFEWLWSGAGFERSVLGGNGTERVLDKSAL